MQGNSVFGITSRPRTLWLRILLSSSTLVAAGGSLVDVQGASATTPKFTGAPIVVATQAPINTPVTTLPQIFAGVQAAARAINAAGGIHGHKVDVLTCNGQANPNAEVACAQSALSAGAVAEVGSWNNLNPGGVQSALEAGNTADVAAQASTVPQYSATNAYPLQFLVGLSATCGVPALAKATGQPVRVAIAEGESPGPRILGQVLSNTISAQGANSVKYVGSVTAGMQTVDLTPQVTQTANLGANTVFEALFAFQDPSFLKAAIGAGHSWNYCQVDSSFTAKGILAFGPQLSHFYLASAFPPLISASRYPALQRFIKQMKIEEAAGDPAASLDISNYSTVGLDAWLGMQVFDQVATSIKGTLDHNTFLAALQHTKVKLGVLPPLNFAKPIGGGQYTHIFNAKGYLLHWNPSKRRFEPVAGGVIQNTFANSGLGSPAATG